MIKIVFDKRKALSLLSDVEDRKVRDVSSLRDLRSVLCLAGACYAIAKDSRVACPACGQKGETLDLVQHAFDTFGIATDDIERRIKDSISTMNVEMTKAGIEFYAHLFSLLRSGEYDSIYKRRILAVLTLGHKPSCEGGSMDPEAKDFCNDYPDYRHVVFLQGLRSMAEASMPNETIWNWYEPL